MTSPRVALMVKPGSGNTGISRYTSSLNDGLRDIGCLATVVPSAGAPLPAAVRHLVRRAGFDLDAFFASYPLSVEIGDHEILHLTTQTQATVLVTQRFKVPVIVTVHDIIPYILRADPVMGMFRHPIDEACYRAALVGLKRADAIVAVSNYTRRMLIDVLGLSPDRIHVTQEAVDHSIFRPIDVNPNISERWKLKPGRQRLLYVGSDDPRKNLVTLVRALGLVRQTNAECELLVVGVSQFSAQHAALQILIADLGLTDSVHFLSGISDDDLALLYNLADLTVMPSLWEGFGLPALEAMACGRAVVVANATSLPEVVGDAARLVAGPDPTEMALAIVTLLNNSAERLRLGAAAHTRSRSFTWEATARATVAVYELVLREKKSKATSY